MKGLVVEERPAEITHTYRPEDVVRAGIRIHPDEPTDVMVRLEIDALAALDELVRERDAAYAEADRLIGERLTIERERDDAQEKLKGLLIQLSFGEVES